MEVGTSPGSTLPCGGGAHFLRTYGLGLTSSAADRILAASFGRHVVCLIASLGNTMLANFLAVSLVQGMGETNLLRRRWPCRRGSSGICCLKENCRSQASTPLVGRNASPTRPRRLQETLTKLYSRARFDAFTWSLDMPQEAGRSSGKVKTRKPTRVSH